MLLRVRVGGGEIAESNSALLWGRNEAGRKFCDRSEREGRVLLIIEEEWKGRRGKDATFKVKGGPVEFPSSVHYRDKVR